MALLGTYKARPDSEQIVNDQKVVFGIDVWLERQSCWNTLEKQVVTPDSFEYTDNGTTICITVADGLGLLVTPVLGKKASRVLHDENLEENELKESDQIDDSTSQSSSSMGHRTQI